MLRGATARLSRTKLALAGASAVVTASVVGHTALASGDENLPWPKYDWDHKGAFSTYDKAAVRRGFEVYRQVCATCHSLSALRYRNLVGVSHTKEQAEALAKSVEIQDGPDDKGEMFTRPRGLNDPLPEPYPNEAAARYVNNGAYPPDLSLIVKARPAGEDYLFALMTGYKDAPHGIKVRQGMSYNPYFPGGLLAMPPPIVADGQVEYEDGTPATISQMAKDVSVFLAWVAEPEMEERKKFAFKAIPAIALAAVLAGYHKRRAWSVLKGRMVYWTKPKN